MMISVYDRKKKHGCFQEFSSFHIIVSTLPKTNFNFSIKIIFSSASAFNLDQSKILSSDKRLTLYLMENFTLLHTTESYRRNCKCFFFF